MLGNTSSAAPAAPASEPVGDRRRARTRADILEAAWELCREKGLAQLSLRELAARVGMRAPSLYSYFSSKDAIYDAMFAAGQRDLLEALDSIPESGLGRAELQQGSQIFFEFCTADPTRYHLLFQRVIPGFQPSEDSYALAVRVLDRLDRQLRSVGVTDPLHRDLWTAYVTGLTDQQISNDPGGDRWARALPTAVDMFCDYVGVPR